MKLTKQEALYLADMVSIHVAPPPGPLNASSPFPEMVLKIMEAIVAHEDGSYEVIHATEVHTDFTYDELMLVYEYVRSSMVIGEEKVGYNLLVKASREILDLKEGKTAIDERVWGDIVDWDAMEEAQNAGSTEPNTSDTKDRAPDDTDKTIPA